jgi:integrase
MEDALLMNRSQAAEALNMSLSHFQRHVQDALPSVPAGQLRLYRPIDLSRWIDTHLRPPDAIDYEPPEACDRLTLGFKHSHEEFIKDCRDGVALNNRGKPYRPKAILSLDSALRRVPISIRGKQLVDVAGFELQDAIDGFIRDGLSPSRVHAIVCAVRSLYTWAIHRGRAAECPAANLRMPAVSQGTPRRVVAPREFVELLAAIPAEDALTWAIAGYATARRQEIEALDWADVDFYENAILLAGGKDARKSESARRIVPMVKQLRVRIWTEWERQGRLESGPIFPPRRADNRSGTADLNAVLRRITKTWRDLGMVPITFQDSRHTAATWLDHAGVSPKVASVMMGHKAPRQNAHPDAAAITLRRYTHVLEGELVHACRQLETFLSNRRGQRGDSKAVPPGAAAASGPHSQPLS